MRKYGKKYLGVNVMLNRMDTHPDTYCAYVTRYAKEAIEYILKIAKESEQFDKHIKSEARIRFKNGSMLTITSGDNPSRLRGLKLDNVLVDGVEKWEENEG